MGHAARERAVRDYSWSAHCRALDAAITKVAAARAREAAPVAAQRPQGTEPRSRR
jgi:hypothetical protein